MLLYYCSHNKVLLFAGLLVLSVLCTPYAPGQPFRPFFALQTNDTIVSIDNNATGKRRKYCLNKTAAETMQEGSTEEGLVVDVGGESTGTKEIADELCTTNVDDNVVGESEDAEKDKDSNEPQTPNEHDDKLLRGWDPSDDTTTVKPYSPSIDYSKLDADETPYEHNFQPGDHVIRWDMLPILWPIQIHGIVLEVSEDKSEVTICDFGITSVKNEEEKIKECPGERPEKIVEEENAIFTEALKDEQCLGTTAADTNGEEKIESADDDGINKKESSKKEKKKKQNQRLNVIKLTKWSDLRKWSKVNYEGGLFGAAAGKDSKMGKSIKSLGKKTEQLWTSMTKSFAKPDDNVTKEKKVLSVRYDVDERGYCVHHPTIQLKRQRDDGDWSVVRKKCPDCIKEDCPAMLGEEEQVTSQEVDSAPSFSSTEDDQSASQSSTAVTEGATETSLTEQNNNSKESVKELSQDNAGGEPPSETNVEEKGAGIDSAETESNGTDDTPKTLEQMIAEANEVDKRSRKTVVPSPERKSMGEKKKSWHGSFMKSLSNIFPKNDKEATTNGDKADNEKDDVTGKDEQEETNPDGRKQKTWKDLPRSDPAILVLARTRFVLEYGEDVLPPYHIINSNSECIAVWCKTGRWSTLQASVFLHSTAIGHAKSATALTVGIAATQPWLIPAFAVVGAAAVGTPWLFLKVANDKWAEATRSLTEKFWMQAPNEVIVDCIEKWGNIQ